MDVRVLAENRSEPFSSSPIRVSVKHRRGELLMLVVGSPQGTEYALLTAKQSKKIRKALKRAEKEARR